MSEPRLISPMLDGFAMGDPISDHDGVRCCPAMPKNSDDKYIVKIISIPASQVQLQALLLTGAYADAASAGDYFRELAQGVEAEAQVLAKLSRMEGFLPFDACQTVPMEKGTGFDVYLLSPYRTTLSKYLRKNAITHLAAINLGLDMCASLAVCRQAGYLYADLKPDNIFVCNDHEFRIGDLGFLKLSSLKYASLPQRCISAYTAPEVVDAYSDLNATMDIYSAGLILYQIYNGGTLPFQERAGGEPLAPPAYADYELSEIILKACAPDPKDRWADPIAMGQALVAYMQRNGVNDVPIVAPQDDPFEPEPQYDEELPQEELAPEDPPVDDAIPDMTGLDQEEDDGEQVCLDEFYAYFSGQEAEAPVQQEADIEQLLDEKEQDPDRELLNLNFLDEMGDETMPSEAMAHGIGYEELSEDAFSILAHADDLISHKTPDGVVAPDPIDIPMPEPIVYKKPLPEEPLVDLQEVAQTVTEAQEPEEENFDDDFGDGYFDPAARRRSAKKWIAWCVVLLMLIGIGFGGYMFYKDYYIRTVSSLTLTGSEDYLTVSIVSDVDESLLTVQCVDTYGQSKTSPVIQGKATFTQLNPNTLYTVKVQVIGMRKLIGDIEGSYTTPAQTNIVSFSAVTGNEPGSAILSFTVDGMDSDTWSVTYSAPGVEEKKLIFGGHVVNVTGLVSGKTYHFLLESSTDLYLTGQMELEYTALDPIFAQDLAITGCTADSLTVAWTAPEGTQVESWKVRCYSDSGYDQTVETADTTLTFTGLNGKEAHTVEVTAQGMSTGSRCYMTAGAVTVSNFRTEAVDSVSMKLMWDHTEVAEGNQWIVTYTAEGASYQEMARTAAGSVTLSPLMPGTSYTVTVLLEDGTTVFSEPMQFTVPEAQDFSGYFLSRDRITVSMCNTPDKANWDRFDLKDEDYTDTFAPGQKASFLLKAGRTYDPSSDVIDTMFVIRTAEGELVSCNITQKTWRNMWYKYYCELDIPALPEAPGDYTIEVYFNGGFLHSQTFHIVEE